MRSICCARRLSAIPISPLPWPLPRIATRRSTASAGSPIATPIGRRHSDLAHRALRSAGDDALALAATAHVLGYFNEDIHVAIAIIDRSLALNPSLAYGWRWSGFARLYAGNPELAIEHFERSIRLNPRDLRWAQLTGIGIAHFFRRRFEISARSLLLALHENPTYPLANRFLAACYAHMGRLDEARQVVARLRTITPLVVLPVTNYRDPQQRELFLSGLRLAAGEAT
jgi:tetratricopeptide (TPR) repeat protein